MHRPQRRLERAQHVVRHQRHAEGEQGRLGITQGVDLAVERRLQLLERGLDGPAIMPSKMRGGVARLGREPGHRQSTAPGGASASSIRPGGPCSPRSGAGGGVPAAGAVRRRRPRSRGARRRRAATSASRPAATAGPCPGEIPSRRARPAGRYSSRPRPGRAAVRLAAGQAQVATVSRCTIPRVNRSARFGGPEALGVEPLGDRRRAEPLGAQRPQPRDQPRVVGLLVVTRHRPGQGVRLDQARRPSAARRPPARWPCPP